MKIAHVSAFYKPTIGGVEKVIEELATRQVKNGHEVHVFVSDFDKNKTIETKEEIIEGVHIHRCKVLFKISQFGLIFPSLYERLVDKHIDINFDIIHSHVFGHYHFVQSSKFAKKCNVKHIHTTHCPWTDANRSFLGKVGVFISYNIFSKKALKSVNKIIAITPWEIEFIKRHGGTDEQIKVIPNGMSKDFFTKIENDFRERNNIKTKYIVLFFGRLNITKGPEKFVEIAKIVLNRRNDVTFVIRGPDEGMREEVKVLIGDEKKIILLNETRDKQEVIKTYQSADVFVMPSLREGLPLTLFEAMACGLPIVASPVNGIPYELEEGTNGFLVDNKDLVGFANKIEKLLNNDKLREEISQNNIEKSRAYDWDLIHHKIMEVYLK